MLDKKFGQTALISLVLALGTWLLYFPALHFAFTNFDDPNYILANLHVNRGWRWREFGWCFQAGFCNNWHPLTWMSHMLDCQLFGLRPRGHHAVNVLLHVCNSVLVFVVLLKMTKATWRSAVVAALFAWHPLHVESVAWISERKDALSTFFGLLTLWAYARYVETVTHQNGSAALPARRNSAKFEYALSLFLFALGLMAKPMLVTLPFVLLLLDAWPFNRFAPPPGLAKTTKAKSPPAFARILSLVIEKFPFFALSIASSVLTYVAQSRTGAVQALDRLPFAARLSNSVIACCRYIEKLIYPINLAVSYPIQRNLPEWTAALAAIVLIALSVGAFALRRRYPYLLMGWLWFLGALVPVIGLVQVGGQAMADRYSYIPSIGLFIAICWGTYDLVRSWNYAQPALIIVTTSALGILAAVTGRQLQYWHNAGTLFRHAIAVTQNNYIAHATLGSYLLNNRDFDKALIECEEAVREMPDYPAGHLFLGQTLFLQGNYERAARELGLVRRIDPHSSDACFLLGQIFMIWKMPDQAAPQFIAALQFDPENAGAHCELGKALAAQGKLEEASAEFRGAIQMVFEYPEAHYQLALTLAAQHQTQEAISHYRTAIKLNPNYPEALNNLAWTLAADANSKIRDGPEAVKLATRACKLTAGRQAIFEGTLAAAYAEAGQFDKAITTAQKAHDLAKAQGEEKVAAKNLELLALYRDHRPYHEN